MTTERKIRRVDIQEILDNPELRRELMVRTLIAIQAREGIEVTRERAEEVYERYQLQRAIKEKENE